MFICCRTLTKKSRRDVLFMGIMTCDSIDDSNEYKIAVSLMRQHHGPLWNKRKNGWKRCNVVRKILKAHRTRIYDWEEISQDTIMWNMLTSKFKNADFANKILPDICSVCFKKLEKEIYRVCLNKFMCAKCHKKRWRCPLCNMKIETNSNIDRLSRD